MLPRTNIDYSTRDYEGFRIDLLNLLAQKIPEYTDFSESDAGVILIELLAHGLDILSYYNDIVANECFFTTARNRDNVIKLATYLGYTPQENTPAEFEQVFTIIPQTEAYTIPAGTKVKTSGSGSDVQIYELLEDLIIPAGKIGDEQTTPPTYDYTGTIRHGQTISDEIMGTSNGSANQQFSLLYNQVIKDSIQIRVKSEISGVINWTIYTAVENFLSSTPQDTHYTITMGEDSRATITFGDGVTGCIPPQTMGGIVATYRIGGGTRGNVTALTINKLEESSAIVKTTFNPSTADILGIDAESIELIKARAVASLRSLNRAVTVQDFSDLALLVPGVLKAKAVELADDPILVKIYALFEGNTTESLTEAQEEALVDYFTDKVVVGCVVDPEDTDCNIQFFAPDFISINFSGTNPNESIKVVTYPTYSNSEVADLILDTVTDYFALGNFDFGDFFYQSQLIAHLMALPEVKSVNIATADNISITSAQIIKLGTLSSANIAVSGGV